MIELKKMTVVVGTGGVGKTTLSSALAVKEASLGKKTLALTIDPAKRLKQALSKSSLKNLTVMTLDTRQTFDALVQKYSPSEEAAHRILNNRLYQYVSTMMAGTQEYMALEKLYELHESNAYDTIILDTPPSKHILSFLQAPDRLAHFLDENILKWFLKPTLSGSSLIFKFIDRLTGSKLLHELSEFLLSLESLYKGFKDRSLKAKEILHSPNTLFLLVTNPERSVFDQGVVFYKNLHALHVSLGGIIINRVAHSFQLSPQEQKEFNKLKLEIQYFKEKINFKSARFPLIEIPFFEEDIYDIKGLNLLNLHLFK